MIVSASLGQIWFFFCLFVLRLYVLVNNFSAILGRLPGFNQY